MRKVIWVACRKLTRLARMVLHRCPCRWLYETAAANLSLFLIGTKESPRWKRSARLVASLRSPCGTPCRQSIHFFVCGVSRWPRLVSVPVNILLVKAPLPYVLSWDRDGRRPHRLLTPCTRYRGTYYGFWKRVAVIIVEKKHGLYNGWPNDGPILLSSTQLTC